MEQELIDLGKAINNTKVLQHKISENINSKSGIDLLLYLRDILSLDINLNSYLANKSLDLYDNVRYDLRQDFFASLPRAMFDLNDVMTSVEGAFVATYRGNTVKYAHKTAVLNEGCIRRAIRDEFLLFMSEKSSEYYSKYNTPPREAGTTCINPVTIKEFLDYLKKKDPSLFVLTQTNIEKYLIILGLSYSTEYNYDKIKTTLNNNSAEKRISTRSKTHKHIPLLSSVSREYVHYEKYILGYDSRNNSIISHKTLNKVKVYLLNDADLLYIEPTDVDNVKP